LRSFPDRLPIFPSRILLHDDLFLQLTDFYPPNPIDEEACELGWFNPETQNRDFFLTIISMLWKIDKNAATQKLDSYENFNGSAPAWGKLFIQKHRRTSQTEGLPPLIVLDINRANVAQFSPEIMNHALCEILRIVPELDPPVVELRVVPMLAALMPIDHDVIQSIVLLLTLAALRKVGFGEIDRAMFRGFLERILLNPLNTTSRFTLYGVLPEVIQFVKREERENLIRAMSSLTAASEHEMVVFLNGLAPLMTELDRLALAKRRITAKPFICQILGDLQLLNPFFCVDYFNGTVALRRRCASRTDAPADQIPGADALPRPHCAVRVASDAFSLQFGIRRILPFNGFFPRFGLSAAAAAVSLPRRLSHARRL
jgi:hypothetical protein